MNCGRARLLYSRMLSSRTTILEPEINIRIHSTLTTLTPRTLTYRTIITLPSIIVHIRLLGSSRSKMKDCPNLSCEIPGSSRSKTENGPNISCDD